MDLTPAIIDLQMANLMPKAFVVILVLVIANFTRAEDFSVAALIGQTGASSTFGKAELDGYQLAVDDWNKQFGGIDGRAVRLIVDDTRTDQKSILSGFHKFAAQGHPVILGPTWLDGMQGVIPVAKSKDVLLVTPSAEFRAFSQENRGPITFYYHSPSEAEALVSAMAGRKMKRVVILFENEPFAELMKTLVIEKSYSSLEVVEQVAVNAGETNFKALIPRLKKLKPDAYLLLVWDESSLLSLLKDLKRLESTTPLVTIHDGEGWLTKPDFRSEISQLLHPRFVVENSAFKGRFHERFGYEVRLTGSNAYDAAWNTLKALSAGHRSGESIRKYLLSNELDTVTFGKIRLSPEGAVDSSRVEIIEFDSTHTESPR